MSTAPKLSQNDLDFYQEIKEIVDETVHAKMEKKLKHYHKRHPHQHTGREFDIAAFEKKYTDEIFRELVDPIADVFENISKFMELLKVDDAHVYNELTRELKKDVATIEDAETIREIEEQAEKHKIKPDLLDKIYKIGFAHYTSGENEKGYMYFNWLCLADVDNPQVWFVKGLLEESLHKFDEAIVSYQRVITQCSSFFYVYTQLIGCYIHKGNLPAAKHLYAIFNAEVDPNEYKHDPVFVNTVGQFKEFFSRS